MTTLIGRFGRCAGVLSIAALMVLAMLAARVAPAVAAGPALPLAAPVLGTRIVLSGPSEVVIGTSVVVGAQLKTFGGNPVPNARIALDINGLNIKSKRTDAAGKVDLSLPSDRLKTATTLNIRVSYAGDVTHRPYAAVTKIIVRPARIDVGTVPVVVGMAISLGDQEVSTDALGVAHFEVDTLGREVLTPHLDLPESPGIRLGFDRWEDEVFDAVRTIGIVGDARLNIGLRVAYRISLQFVDPDGRIVDPKLIQSVQMETSSGAGRTLSTFDAIWLEAQVPAKRSSGLVAVPNLHRLSAVVIAGTNVVNRGQQTWEPTLNGTWTIDVLLYQLAVRVEDALLKFPIVTSVTLEYPDRTTVSLTTDSDGQVSFGALPRGDYRIVVHAHGIVPPSPIALSRPQETRIRVISNLDLSIGGGVVIGVILALVLLGRRHQVTALGRAGLAYAEGAGRGLAVVSSRSDQRIRGAVVSGDTWVRGWTSGRTDAALRRLLTQLGRSRVSIQVRESFGKSDQILESALADPGRRRNATAIGLVLMALVVLATASTLVGAIPTR